MKKFLALLSLFTLLTAFTCENEPLGDGVVSNSNNNNTTNVALIGTWSLEDFSVSLNTVTNFDGETFASEIEIESTQEDYDLEFTETTFLTNGNYSYSTNITVDGEMMSSDTYTISSVEGNGSYSTNGNQMTTDGTFFEFEFEGMDESALQGEQTATYSLSSDGQTLTFSQDETTTETDPTTGIEVTNTINSTSVWARQ